MEGNQELEAGEWGVDLDLTGEQSEANRDCFITCTD
jgi:hypothetical protein